MTKAVLAAERKKSRQLEKELRRKEKALAETAALLTLSKKARAIWGNYWLGDSPRRIGSTRSDSD